MINKPPQALVFGEHDNDRTAIIELILALRPDLSHIAFRKIRDPVVYQRLTELPSTRKKNAAQIAKIYDAAKAVYDVKFVVTHQDCDAAEPAHESVMAATYSELNSSGVVNVIPANPAYEIETWWMLFPKELKKVQPLWLPVDYSVIDIGSIIASKERLIKDLRPLDAKVRSKCRDYEESDSIKIAKKIRETNAVNRPLSGASSSFDAFRKAVECLVI